MAWVREWWPAVMLIGLGVSLAVFFAIAFWGQDK